jgi:hypothetical protein
VVNARRVKPARCFRRHVRQSQSPKDEDFMDTHLMVGVAVMFGLIGIAASRDLLRRLRQQPQLAPIRIERPEAGEKRSGR